MTESQYFRREAMRLLRNLAPADYLIALEREREVDVIAENAARAEPLIQSVEWREAA